MTIQRKADRISIMTRGKLVLIVKGKAFISTEFNGDMYPDGHGAKVFANLSLVKNITQFKRYVANFNSEEFEYTGKLVYEAEQAWLDNAKDFRNQYFDNWFSDWLYIKNLDDQPITFREKDSGNQVTIPSKETVAFNFGGLPDQKDQGYLNGYRDALTE